MRGNYYSSQSSNNLRQLSQTGYPLSSEYCILHLLQIFSVIVFKLHHVIYLKKKIYFSKKALNIHAIFSCFSIRSIRKLLVPMSLYSEAHVSQSFLQFRIITL